MLKYTTHMRNTTHNGYELSIGDRPLTDVPAILLQGGALDRKIAWPALPFHPGGEEGYLADLDLNSASGLFDRTRQQVKQALRAIAAWAQNEYAVPRSNGCDFGAGATGFMVEELLEGLDKKSWMQVDIHPGAVAANQAKMFVPEPEQAFEKWRR